MKIVEDVEGFALLIDGGAADFGSGGGCDAARSTASAESSVGDAVLDWDCGPGARVDTAGARTREDELVMPNLLAESSDTTRFHFETMFS